MKCPRSSNCMVAFTVLLLGTLHEVRPAKQACGWRNASLVSSQASLRSGAPQALLKVQNHRKSSMAMNLLLIEPHGQENPVAGIPAHQTVTLQVAVGTAWRARDGSNGTVLWQHAVVDSKGTTHSVQDCSLSPHQRVSTPLSLSVQSSAGQGASITLDDNAKKLCGGLDWSTCPPHADMTVTVEVHLGELHLPQFVPVDFPRATRCTTCNGTGAAAPQHAHTCSVCQGTGLLHHSSPGGHNSPQLGYTTSLRHVCPACQGFGMQVHPDHVCPICGGEHVAVHNAHLNFTIPASVKHGAQTHLAGEGEIAALHSAGTVRMEVKVGEESSVQFEPASANTTHLGDVDFHALATAAENAGSVQGMGGPRCLVEGILVLGHACSTASAAVGVRVEQAADLAKTETKIEVGKWHLGESLKPLLRALPVDVVRSIPSAVLERLDTSKVFLHSAAEQHESKAPSKLELLELAGLYDSSRFTTVTLGADTSPALHTHVSIDIMQAVSGFHARVPLPDGRAVHAVVPDPSSPTQVLQLQGFGLPVSPQPASLPGPDGEVVCLDASSQPTSPPVLPPPQRSVLVKVRRSIDILLQCVASPSSASCPFQRPRRDGLLQAVPALQLFSFASFAQVRASAAYTALATLGGCERVSASAGGAARQQGMGQDRLSRSPQVRRCLERCQEEGERGLGWKQGWCTRQCPDIVGIFEALKCVEALPQRHRVSLGAHTDLTAARHADSIPPGTPPPCHLPAEVLAARSTQLHSALATHIDTLCQHAGARVLSLHVLATQLQQRVGPPDGGLHLTVSALLLAAVEADLASLRTAAAAMEEVGSRGLAQGLLHISSSISLFTPDERAAVFDPLYLTVHVQHPTRLDPAVQAAIRSAFS